VPFSPPEDLKNKVSKFMNIMNLDTGSIDIIVRKDSQFVFLEVNPIGQFSDMSYNCNYFLEKKIVEKLL
jgi:D-alanine-D-alanine ligase-like ATP-grasp enzyme